MAKKTIFTLAANIAGEAESGILVGEFNNWDESKGIALKKQKDGSFKAEVALEPGTYHYRYFLSDGRWVNDGNAEHYAPVHGLHVDNCVITVAEEAPAPKKAKAEPKAKEEAPKKAAAPKKEAAKPAPKAKAEPKPKAEKAPATPKATKTKK
jgi:1,4-alpha-glucan branching enzyme